MANIFMKRCTILLIITKIQIKSLVRYELISFRIVIIKDITSSWECGVKGTIVTCLWKFKLVHPLWKQFEDFSKNYKWNHNMLCSTEKQNQCLIPKAVWWQNFFLLWIDISYSVKDFDRLDEIHPHLEFNLLY